jgi:hypothetical protein
MNTWITSSYSSYNGNCVQVGGSVAVRDSKLGEDSPLLRFTPQAWKRFTGQLKSG